MAFGNWLAKPPDCVQVCVCVCVCVLGCVSLEMILIRHVVSWRVPAHTPGKVVLRFQIN